MLNPAGPSARASSPSHDRAPGQATETGCKSAFKTLLATRPNAAIAAGLVDLDDDDLMPGGAMTNVDYSPVNYKDALALSGEARVIQAFPPFPGSDIAGTVRHSTNPEFKTGERWAGAVDGNASPSFCWPFLSVCYS